eukprot:3408886-Rhodomonas_salina.2
MRDCRSTRTSSSPGSSDMCLPVLGRPRKPVLQSKSERLRNTARVFTSRCRQNELRPEHWQFDRSLIAFDITADASSLFHVAMIGRISSEMEPQATLLIRSVPDGSGVVPSRTSELRSQPILRRCFARRCGTPHLSTDRRGATASRPAR